MPRDSAHGDRFRTLQQLLAAQATEVALSSEMIAIINFIAFSLLLLYEIGR